MTQAREYDGMAAFGAGQALAAGGDDGNGNVLATADVYSPSGAGGWTATAPMASARERFTAVTLKDGRVLVSGGLDAARAVLGTAEIWDPATGAWTAAGTMATARYGHTATLLKTGQVLVAGGCTATGCSTISATAELYDPVSNSWSTTGGLALARRDQLAVRLANGRVLAIGGAAPTASSACEIYDPIKGIWSAAASTHDPRWQAGASVLPDGDVLVSGGTITRFPIGTAETYNPTTNLWTYTAPLKTPRYGHSSTGLSDGTVLLAGGEGQSISCGKACTTYIPTAAVEIYNPASGAFTTAAALPRALAYQEVVLTRLGKALAAGGVGYSTTCCQAVADSESYTPLTLTLSATSLEFGVEQVGLTSQPQTVTVTNASDHPSTFTGIIASGDYAQTNTCPTTLNPGAECAISVTFTPTKGGNRAGTVTIKDNDPGSPSQSIALTGVGEALALAFTPASLNFGSVVVGSSSALSAMLTNDGPAAVNIGAITIEPPRKTFTETNTCPATLAVQQSCTVSVTFTPPDVANYKAQISAANGAGAPAILAVNGSGLDNN